MAEKKTFKAGDDVRVVLANGQLAPAKVVKYNKDGTADLEFTHLGQEVTITSSPFDETGGKPDSWCPAAADAKPA
jgi:hypothetical protein